MDLSKYTNKVPAHLLATKLIHGSVDLKNTRQCSHKKPHPLLRGGVLVTSVQSVIIYTDLLMFPQLGQSNNLEVMEYIYQFH